MIEEILSKAESEAAAVIVIAWLIYKLKFKSKNGRMIDIIVVSCLTLIAMSIIILRGIIIITG